MKKSLNLILLLFGLFFIGNLNVYADNCSTYGCVTCKYAVSDGYLTIKATGDGKGGVTVTAGMGPSSSMVEQFEIKNNISSSKFVSSNKATCPKTIFYTKSGGTMLTTYTLYESASMSSILSVSLNSEENNNLALGGSGDNDNNNNDNNNNNNNNNGNNNNNSGTGAGGSNSNIKVDLNLGENGCQSVLTSELIEWLQWVLDVVRIGALILTVILGIVDYVNATFSSKDDSIAKANKNFTTRLMALALLFLVPTLIEFILSLFSISTTGDDPRCGLQ